MFLCHSMESIAYLSKKRKKSLTIHHWMFWTMMTVFWRTKRTHWKDVELSLRWRSKLYIFFFIAINHFYYYYNIQKADTCIKEKMTWRKNIVSIMKKIINYEISDLVIRKNSKSSYGLEETPLNNVFKLSCPVSLRVQQGL